MSKSSVFFYEKNDDLRLQITSAEYIEGVPLTDDILKKSGFRGGYNGRRQIGYFHILDENGFSAKFTIEHWTKTENHNERFHADHIGKIEFVHQLQNLLSVMYDIELDFSFLKTDFKKQ
ncbi:hypothetical protein Barb6XT_02897 [Bacteroidales bacterium Barb6XT]|nr:hypothetical protein Barb6XT_02897 [Bacteroidales bacterium Barb6XT]